ALTTGQEFGIWGGWDENERQLLHRQWRQTRIAADEEPRKPEPPRRRHPAPATLPARCMQGSAAKVGSTVEIGQCLGLAALMYDRESDHSCPDVLPTLLTSDICRCWCPSGCEVQKTASRSRTKASCRRLSGSSRSRRRWQMSLRRTSPGATAGGPRSVFADPWSTTA